MTYTPPEAPAPRIIRGANWLNKHKFIVGFLFSIVGLLTMYIGAQGMKSFILEESLQRRNMSYALPALNKEFEIALAVLKRQEESIYRESSWLRRIWNPLTGGAFKAYARASIQGIQSDKSFFEYMVKKARRQEYLAKLNRVQSEKERQRYIQECIAGI